MFSEIYMYKRIIVDDNSSVKINNSECYLPLGFNGRPTFEMNLKNKDHENFRNYFIVSVSIQYAN